MAVASKNVQTLWVQENTAVIIPFNAECASEEIKAKKQKKETKSEGPRLKKDGTPKKICHNKKKGKKSEVYALQIEDAQNILAYLRNNEMWIHYMIFVLGCNMGRRISDTMSLKWSDIFDPRTGEFMDNIEMKEIKTDKFATPRLNSACREAINLYINKTGCDPSKDNYGVEICMQLSGTHRGKVLSYSGYQKVIKRTALELGIKYNVGTHSTRKMFGKITMMLHPGESDCINVLQQMFNHSDQQVTTRYIDITPDRFNKYYDDFGHFFSDYVAGDKKYEQSGNNCIVHIGLDDLMTIINLTYETALDNADSTNAMTHVNAVTQIMEMIDTLKK